LNILHPALSQNRRLCENISDCVVFKQSAICFSMPGAQQKQAPRKTKGAGAVSFKTFSEIFDVNILFVCMGNICRSPTAEGVLRHRVEREGLAHAITVDSAGTHNYHPGSPPDQRNQHHARLRGYDLANLRARQINPNDFAAFDLILTMDSDNQTLIERACPASHRPKLRRFSEFFLESDSPFVPDPYYGSAEDFELVLDLVEDGVNGLIRFYREHWLRT